MLQSLNRGHRGHHGLTAGALVTIACIALASCGRGPGGGQPDLAVESAAVSDRRPAAGASFTLSATVRNTGGGNAAATTLRVYRSGDATVTRSDTEVGTGTVAELAAAGIVTVPVELTAPSAGTYHYAACVDAVDGESDTGNNCSAAVPVTVAEAPAAPIRDLVLEPPAVSDPNPPPGGGFTLSVRVRNSGSGTAVDTVVRFHRSTDPAITPSDPAVGTAAIAELAAAESRAAAVELTAPPTPGAYYYGACVESVDGQSGTANDCSAPVPVTVRALPASAPNSARPDLVLQPPQVREFGSGSARFWLISADVSNAGAVTAPATRASFYRSTDATITGSDTLMFTERVPELAPSQRAYVANHVLMTHRPGTYYFGACVEAVAGESDRTNNCRAAQPVTVVSRPTDLQVYISTPVYPASPAVGGKFTLPVAVHNPGEKVGGVVSLRYYRSDDTAFTSSVTQVRLEQIRDMARFRAWSLTSHLDSPSSTGVYYYRVCADALAGESDTTNNCSTAVKVAVTHDKPNLVIGFTRYRGKTSMYIRAENVGSSIDEDKRWVRFFRSTDATITTADTQIGAEELSWISPSDDFDYLYTVAKVTLPATAGTYYFGACVDVADGEFDTTDNCSRRPVSYTR